MKKVLNLLYLLSYLSLIVKFPQTLSYPKMTACIITLRPVNLYLLFLILLLPIQSIAAGFRLDQIAQLPGIPWGMDFINQNKLIITLRSGSLVLLNVQKGEFSHLSGLPEITADGQGGLLDVAIGPNYQTQGWIFFTYSKTTDRGDVTTLARAKIDGSNLVNWQDLLITDSATDTGRHFGSRIAFEARGHVLCCTRHLDL